MKFKAVLQAHGKTATGFEVPPEIVERLGAGKRPLVQVTIKGHTYPSVIAVMGGAFMIGVSAENRAAAGVAAGDRLEVNVELDTEPRRVELPADFERALKKSAVARRTFEALSNSGKKRHVVSIEGAKTDETRMRRIAKAIEELEHGTA